MKLETKPRLRNFQYHLISGLIGGIIFFMLFAKFVKELLYYELEIFDQTIINLIRVYDSPYAYKFMKFISFLGSPITLILLACGVFYLLMYIKKHYWDANMVIINLLGCWGMNELLKAIFHRDRPEILRMVEVSGFSFPSGHAMISFSFYGMLLYLMWINSASVALRVSLSIIWALLVFCIGVSRVYLGVHYPSDVLAGFAAGGLWLIGCILGLQGIRYYKSEK